MACRNVFLLMPLACLLAITNISATRAKDFPITSGYNPVASPEPNGFFSCLNAIKEIKSCSKEILNYIHNDKTSNISPACCRAISIITYYCWPAFLISIDFTVEEGDILRAYCDGASLHAAATPHAGSPVRPA